MRRWLWLFGGLLILGVLPLLAQNTPGAHWRLGHFAVDVAEVDVYLDNTLTLQQVKLASLSAWRDLPAGAHTVTVTPAGGTLDRPLVLPFTLNVQAGDWATLALAGRRTDGTLKLHAVLEDMRPLSTGLTRLGVFNAFPNNPPLAIRLDDKDIIRRLAYPGTLPEGNDGLESREILAGSYNLKIELADGQLVKEVPSIGLGAGRAYLLVIFGTLDRPFTTLVATEITASGTPVVPTSGVPVIVPTATLAASTPVVVVPTVTLAAFSTSTSDTVGGEAQPTVTLALPVVAGAEAAHVRFGHFVPGTQSFTFYIDGQPAAELSNADGGTIMTVYQDLPPGPHTLAVVLKGETLDQAFLTQNVSFNPGATYLVAAVGSLQIGAFAVVVAEEKITVPAGQAQVAVFNAIPDAEKIALFRVGVEKPVFSKVPFTLAYDDAGTGYAATDLVPGRYQFVVAEDKGNDVYVPLATLPELRLGEGRYYTLIITGLKDQVNQPHLVFSSYPPSKPVLAPNTATATPTPNR